MIYRNVSLIPLSPALGRKIWMYSVRQNPLICLIYTSVPNGDLIAHISVRSRALRVPRPVPGIAEAVARNRGMFFFRHFYTTHSLYKQYQVAGDVSHKNAVIIQTLKKAENIKTLHSAKGRRSVIFHIKGIKRESAAEKIRGIESVPPHASGGIKALFVKPFPSRVSHPLNYYFK